MTRRDKFSTKIPTRMIYTDVASKCPICLKLHNKSKKFGTPYHLLYHLITQVFLRVTITF